MNDYVFLAIIAVLSIGGGLYLLREARRWRQRRDDTRSAHITPVGGNVFADLGFEPDEAAALKAESTARIGDRS